MVPAALPLTSAAFVSQTPLRLQVKTAWLTVFIITRDISKASRVSRMCAAGHRGFEVALRLCPRLVYNHPYRLRKPRGLDSQNTGRDNSVEHQVLHPCHCTWQERRRPLSALQPAMHALSTNVFAWSYGLLGTHIVFASW